MTLQHERTDRESRSEEHTSADQSVPLLPAPRTTPLKSKSKRSRLRKLKPPTAMAGSNKRQISTIAFPYVDLEGVIGVARAMNDVGGLAMTRDQLAGALKQSPGSGAFILKISAARQFGIVEQTQNGKYQLTQLGFNTVSKDEAQERSARVEAFLNVQLYKRAYDEFKGRPLPPRPLGLESAFVQFGVAPKQKDTARQIFEKSARQAGFFNVDSDRLIEPLTGPVQQLEKAAAESQAAQNNIITTAQSINHLDPLIQGLVDRLPEPGSKWEPEKRARWLQTLAANFDMVYETDSENTVIVEIKSLRARD